MTWARVDDSFSDHPKVVGCSLQAIGLWTLCLTWARGHKTGGVVPRGLPRRFGDRTGRAARELLAVGLWECQDDEWVIHDFAKYGPPSDLSAKRAAAGKLGGLARQRPSKRQANAKQAASSGFPVPVPDPVPGVELSTNVSSSTGVEGIFSLWQQTYGHSLVVLTKERRALVAKWLKERGERSCRAAVLGMRHDSFFMGDNDRGRKYDDLKYVFSEKNFDRFVEYELDPNTRPSGKRDGKLDQSMKRALQEGKVDTELLEYAYRGTFDAS